MTGYETVTDTGRAGHRQEVGESILIGQSPWIFPKEEVLALKGLQRNIIYQNIFLWIGLETRLASGIRMGLQFDESIHKFLCSKED